MAKNWEEKAYRAWSVLTQMAKSGNTVSYEQLGGEIGVDNPRNVRLALGPIQDYCRIAELPPLTILVVSSTTRKPGSGFTEGVEQGLKKVQDFDWESEENPFEFSVAGDSKKSLIKQLKKNPESAGDVYRKIKYRGMQQMQFRAALLEIYGGKCAFTGLSFETGLDACHIIPWENASEAQKMDLRNGILLNSFHHRLFDRGLITITRDHKITVCLGKKLHAFTDADKYMVERLSETKMQCPQKGLRPLPEYISKHNELLELSVE